VHDAVNTEESNAALWAAMKGAFLRSGKRVGASSANDGLPFTIGYDMPWIAVNSNSGVGGQIRLVKTESTTPSTTDTTDTAHALSRERFAVSKSIATKVDPSGSGIIFVRTRRAFGVAARRAAEVIATAYTRPTIRVPLVLPNPKLFDMI
jgi:hypothetical protein